MTQMTQIRPGNLRWHWLHSHFWKNLIFGNTLVFGRCILCNLCNLWTDRVNSPNSGAGDPAPMPLEFPLAERGP